MNILGFGWDVCSFVPKRAGYHQVCAISVASDGNIVDATLSEEHLNIGLMRLWVEIVDEEDGEADFLSDDHRGYFGVASKRAGVHTGNVSAHAPVPESVFD
jgi:hypothetical protein